MSLLDGQLTRTMSLGARLSAATPARRSALTERLGLVVATLTGSPAPTDRDELLSSFERELAAADPSAVWLAASVLDARLATSEDVRRIVRTIRLDGVTTAFGTPWRDVASDWLPGAPAPLQVRVVSDIVLVDLDHTAKAGLATGIQRVARETTRRWVRDHPAVLVGWGGEHTFLRLLEADEVTKALTGEGRPRTPTSPVAVVPWRATFLLPELSPESPRNRRIAALAQFARSRTGVIGFDCVPISTAETTALGVSEAFAGNLAAVRHMDAVSAISRAAAAEYGGWRTMLASIGRTGPEITAELLPAEAPDSSLTALDAARSLLTLPGVPMVLCVGTHEPRKNHVALLHAAELLWREGVRFNLVLVGGRSWNDGDFRAALTSAQARNRPVQTVTTMTDEVLWAAYRVARCTVFPSLNEGFGLPVAEALACGTPVVTSGYGSMAEIAADGGAVLVDPRDDVSIAAGLRSVLLDDQVHQRLTAEARARPVRTWDDYAADVWKTLVP